MTEDEKIASLTRIAAALEQLVALQGKRIDRLERLAQKSVVAIRMLAYVGEVTIPSLRETGADE